MNFNSFFLKQAIRQMGVPESVVKEIDLVGRLSDVDGSGFPRELIQLNAPMITRGLLNFSLLQMNRNWVYPFWVHRQLDPRSEGFIPRSHNPLLINVTHRNWTAIGSPYGRYESIIDPRGLLTPLPREWSLDVWLVTKHGVFFPSLSESVVQVFDPSAPSVQTAFEFGNLYLEIESFVDGIRRDIDVVFHRATVRNQSNTAARGMLCFAIRPFNPEGVALIESIELKSPRIAYVNNSVGVVFAEEPDGIVCANDEKGDIAWELRQRTDAETLFSGGGKRPRIECRRGLAHAAAGFQFSTGPGELARIHCSVALETDRVLVKSPVKQTWRVSFESRRNKQRERWRRELGGGTGFVFADSHLQSLFDTCRSGLLQLHDGDFISPGPYTYHTFWFRDAAVMLHALDMLGYYKRSERIIDTFPNRMTDDGFFKGPDGEWDSNGAVIWTIYRHFLYSRSELWLRKWYPVLQRAARWILAMRRKSRATSVSVKGLMPKSLSAEHLGMVDQYYWDSFWSLGGLKCMEKIAQLLNKQADAEAYRTQIELFERDIFSSLDTVAEKLGVRTIPASPFRSFDEGAIGSLCAIYPLQLFDPPSVYEKNTLSMIAERYVDTKGFFHPLIHSGYNPYLTMQIAHAFLVMGDPDRAWETAKTVFAQATQTGTYPEAIHPVTGGGTMGDGHHGWAAAEIVTFIRDCLVRETGNTIEIFGGGFGELVRRGSACRLENVPSSYGSVNVDLEFPSHDTCKIRMANTFEHGSRPEAILLHVPFRIAECLSGNADHIYNLTHANGRSTLRLSPAATQLYLTCG